MIASSGEADPHPSLAPAKDAITRAAEGAITPFDAAELACMVETALRAFEIRDFDRRLAALEREEAREADNRADNEG